MDSLASDLNSSITPTGFGVGHHVKADEKTGLPTIYGPLSPKTSGAASKEELPGAASNEILPPGDNLADTFLLRSPSRREKLPVITEEIDSTSGNGNSSAWDTSSTSCSSIGSSATLSMRASSQRGNSGEKLREERVHKKNSRRLQEDTRGHKFPVIWVLAWPLRKVRDGYMRCMIGLDGAGDLTGLAQGSTFAASSSYFSYPRMSKTDPRKHG